LFLAYQFATEIGHHFWCP